jgi:hypothetical protein
MPFTAEGRHVEVVHPGRVSEDGGPDFRDAVIAIDGERVRGDVELHVRASDWRAHGHHRDPRYNSVILHVVLWSSGGLPIGLENGKTVPTLVLSQYLDGSIGDICPVPAEPCYQAAVRLGDAMMGELLDNAGEERFLRKAALFQEGLRAEQANQVLYQGIMRALGYSKNKERFQELASLMPLSVIQGLIHQGEGLQRQHLMLQALLLGTAGLLPSQRGIMVAEETVSELEGIWRSLDALMTVNPEQWRFFRLRPHNLPARRLVAASYLLVRYMREGLARSALDLVAEARGHRGLEAGFMIAADGYWRRHFDFGCEGNALSLIGRGRARELIVNIILPFVWAMVGPQQELGRRALELYRCYPNLVENRITRSMQGLLWGKRAPTVVNSAQRQQGLLHIYHSFCWQWDCLHCPLMALNPA